MYYYAFVVNISCFCWGCGGDLPPPPHTHTHTPNHTHTHTHAHTHIPNHTDDTIDNYHHIRYNLFLLKPLRGGDCLYDSQKYSPNEREYIMCDATKNHSTTPIIGLKPRIVISYGFLIKK